MLLEFELENERAFAAPSTLSLIASKLKDRDKGAVRNVGDLAGTLALTSAIILGKNGSGKSSLIDALQFFGRFVRGSATEEAVDAPLPYDPNVLSAGGDGKPSYFRMLFSVDGVIYNFSFSHNRERILTEEMEVADKSTRFRRMFYREWDPKQEDYLYNFGEALSGSRKVWSDSTRENALFLSTAVHLNSADLRIPFDWITKFLRAASIGKTGKNYTIRRCFEDEKFKRKVVNFLQSMDINVEDFDFEEEYHDPTFWDRTFSKEFLDSLKDHIEKVNELKDIKVFFKKKSERNEIVRLPFSEESTGTQAIFCLAGPLFDVLENGYCLLIDELNTSLHPLIVKFLIDMFADENVNTKRAQLIFTSHDVSVLRENVLRRDQVWFIESDGFSANLVPLSDYSPRKGEALEKGYLSGRYGGVPTLIPTFLRDL